MKKRILATVLAAMMLTSTAVVFAEDAVISAVDENGAYTSATDYTGTTKVPTIKVTVPTEGSIVINPYGMDADGEGDTSEVVSAAALIKNESDVAISVDVKTTGTLPEGSEMVLAKSALTGKETTKSACLWVEAWAAEEDGTLAEGAEWKTAYDSRVNKNQAIIVKGDTTVKGIAQMAAGNETATYAAFKVLGDVVAEPATPWADKDTVNVKVAYTFVPQAAEAVAPEPGTGD